jgi:hypothetical protein
MSKLQSARQIAETLRKGRERYAAMVDALLAGDRPPWETVCSVLKLADRTAEDLLRDLIASDWAPVRSGDPCEKQECDGHLIVYCSKQVRGAMIRYLKCGACGNRPTRNKQRLPASRVRQRRHRKACT